jgi:feruloyl-CoA synthase
VAKVLFTSGSTGEPKGVINTQRMICSNQQAIVTAWPFLRDRPPVVLDWLPWSHTFGANHNFFMALFHGGALYVDDGRPTPELVTRTCDNLREISPTLYFNVPRGFDVLLPRLEADPALRDAFFRDLDVVFYAAASLPNPLWERLEALSIASRGERVHMLSAWGSTETSPLATTVHFHIPRAGVIGLPAPGTTIKLAPAGDRLELCVKGPNVTPGYWRRPDLAASSFDDEGFLRMGDAGKLADDADPAKGIVFDGRLGEDFKLSSGTWVHVGALRVELVARLAPLVMDAVVTGLDRDEIGLLLFAGATPPPDVLPRLREHLRAHNLEHPHGSQRIGRALWMTEPPGIDAGEVTDKGYINQAAVLRRRAALVERLYRGEGEDVITGL